MTDMGDGHHGYRPTQKKWDPNDPHFNPFHPPIGTPDEVIARFWGEDDEDDGPHDKTTDEG